MSAKHSSFQRRAVVVAAMTLHGLAAVALEPGWIKVIIPPELVEQTVPLSEATNELAQRGARHVGKAPDGAEVFAIPEAESNSFAQRDDFILKPEWDRIKLSHREIDTRVQPDLSADAASRLKYIQFPLPPTAEELKGLQQTGARLLHYIGNNAYLVWSPDEDCDAAVRSSLGSPGAPQYYAPTPGSDKIPALNIGRAAETVNVEVLLFADHPAFDEELASAKSEGMKVHGERREGEFHRLSISVPASSLARIADLPSTVVIANMVALSPLGESSNQIISGLVDSSGNPSPPRSNPGKNYIDWLRNRLSISTGFGVPGNYPIVSVVDNGIGSGDEFNPQGDTEPYFPFPAWAVAESDFRAVPSNGSDATGESRIMFSWIWNRTINQVDLSGDGATEPDPLFTTAPDHGHVVASILGGWNARPNSGTFSEPSATEREHETSVDATGSSTGYDFGLGVSPFGRIGNVHHGFGSPSFAQALFDSSDLEDLYYQAYLSTRSLNGEVSRGGLSGDGYRQYFQHLPNPAAIANNSWGVLDGTPLTLVTTYGPIPTRADVIARDALVDNKSNDRSTVGPHPFLMVCAAGQGAANVISPGLAKNVLTMGGSEGVRQEFKRESGANLGAFETQATVPERMNAANDVWGELTDPSGGASKGVNGSLRVKPDIVAPATWNTGSAFHYYKSGVGLVDGDFSSYATDGRAYRYSSTGTSFASAMGAGAVQVACKFMRDQYGIVNPSPALMKAYAINAAKFLTGWNTTATPTERQHLDNPTMYPKGNPDPIPNKFQGFGRLDLEKMLDDSLPRFLYDQQTVLTGTGSMTFTGRAADVTKPVRITLVWTDPAPSGDTTGDVKNNLDLVVKTDRNHLTTGHAAACYEQTYYHGNKMYAAAAPVSGAYQQEYSLPRQSETTSFKD
ncbi:MAG: S8 family serine peptidase [Candidatus Sumerlaeia bacterium]|nr:S8 family serine peptidase [Candidatus Sumerlaeia bacterium]